MEEEILFQTYLRNLSVAYRKRLDANSNPDITVLAAFMNTGPILKLGQVKKI
jgi:hypothetical protein